MSYEDKINEIKHVCLTHGYKKDRFGNLKKTIMVNGEEREYRIKFQATSYRKEVKYVSDYGSHKQIHWFKVGGDYYKNIVIRNNKIARVKK